MAGILYIVATPIGNLQDITLRALDTLKSVDLIAAEDTRHSKKLLEHYNVTTRLLALHDHNEREKYPYLLSLLEEGKSIALISDAGTPLISDPGYHLVTALRAAGIKIVPVPGACAAIAALSVAGLPTDQFLFVGFLPSKSQARQNRLSELKLIESTLIFYEAPHRILDLITDVIQVFGDERQLVIARELTKTFETILSGSAAEILQKLKADPHQQLGEFVVLIEGKTQETAKEMQQALQVYQILAKELPMKQAVQLAAEISKIKKNALYEQALKLLDK